MLTNYQVSPYLLDNPQAPMIQIAGLEHADYDIEFQSAAGYQAEGDRLLVQIEACLQRTSDRVAQEQLDALHAANGLKHAAETDRQLTSRLNDDGTIDISQAPAADDLRVTEYLGSAPFTTPKGVQVLLATWRVEILT